MKRAIGLIAVAGLFLLACAHSPTKPGERADLVNDAQSTLARMQEKDPSLRPLIEQSVGYIVFPKVGSGGFIVAGGAGAGVLYERGRHTGFAELNHASVGAVAGGQSYAQLVIFNDQRAIDDLKAGRFDFGAQASAVILRTGAAAATSFSNGVAVFKDPIRGAMVSASLRGERIRMSM
jgi:lipid-binding SYLF domain-containing protein